VFYAMLGLLAPISAFQVAYSAMDSHILDSG